MFTARRAAAPPIPRRRRGFRFGLAALLGMLCLPPAFSAPPPENRAAPPFEIRSLNGETITSENTRGKVVVLNFWATWCHSCRAEMPALEKFYREHQRNGLEVVAVNIGEASDEAEVRQFTAPYSFPVALVGAAKLAAYGSVSFVPVTFVIDRQGVLRKSAWNGSKKINSASLSQYVLPLLREP